MELWRARERTCGRMIEALRDPQNTTPIVPEVCPECGARPVTVDLVELLDSSAIGLEAEGEPLRASSAAIELADRFSVDMSKVKGSGKGGAVTKSDVQAVIDLGGADLEEAQAMELAQLAGLDPAEVPLALPGTGRLTRADVLKAIGAAFVPEK